MGCPLHFDLLVLLHMYVLDAASLQKEGAALGVEVAFHNCGFTEGVQA